MAFGSWRGTIGLIKPTYRPGGLEEFIRLLPEGIGVLPMFMGISRGTVEEFKNDSLMDAYEAKIKELAGLNVDLIHPEGAPPFMVRGFDEERRLIDRWEEAYKIPIMTAGTTQVQAMRALGVSRIVGVTYFRGQVNDFFAKYFTDAGFEVLGMYGMDVDFADAGRLASHEVYAHTKRSFFRHQNADCIYMLGSGWRTLDILGMLEQDCEVPVVHPVPARIWAFQHALHVRQRIPGLGRLLEELPKPR